MSRFVHIPLCLIVLTFLTVSVIADIPDLTGNWTGESYGYVSGTGFVDYPQGTLSLNITEQKDRVFAGFLLATDKEGKILEKNVVGVINDKGTAFYMAEEKEGFSYAEINGTDEIEITYINSAEPVYGGIDHFSRSR